MRPKQAEVIRNLAALLVNDSDALGYISGGRGQPASALGHPPRNIPRAGPAILLAVGERKCHANARAHTDTDPYRYAIPISVRHGLKPSSQLYRGLKELPHEAGAGE